MTPRSSWLHRDASVADAFERRAERAAQLAKGSGNADVLEFAAGLYRAQAKVAAALAGASWSGALAHDLDSFRSALDAILRHARDRGPPGLRAEVDAVKKPAALTERLLDWWRSSRAGRTDYLARAVLRPYGETLAAGGVTPEPLAATAATRPVAGACVRCSAPPWIAWRRSGAGDEAAQRYLGCALCGSEGVLGRIACAGCGQTEPDKLPVFHTERHATARIEACDACLRYVKSIDLTVDGLAVPEIDDLASLSLDLWAAEQGYERLEPSLAGV